MNTDPQDGIRPDRSAGRTHVPVDERLVRAEQVRQLYRNAPLGMIATVANSLIVAYVERHVVSAWALAAWLGCVALVTLLRYVDVLRYRAAAVTPDEADRWGTRFVVGMALAGLAWGSAAVLLFPVESLAHQIFLTFVLGGMVAGAAGTFSVLLTAFLVFTVPALGPVTLRLFAAGQDLPVAMGAMALLFALLMTATALRVRAAAVTSLRYRFENDNLIAALQSERDQIATINRELTAEIEEREKTERELERHRDHLKERVAERTKELTLANERLKQDVEERRRAQEALQTSEARFRRLVENATDAFFLHDAGGRFIDVNEQACHSLGYSREELLRLGLADISVHYDARGIRGVLEKLVVDAPMTLEDLHRRKDGSTFPVECRVSMLERDGKRLSLSLARDITERKRAEKVLREALKTAEEATRSKSEFLANMSHEIRTPMSGLLGMIDLVLRKPLPKDQRVYLQAAQRSARSLLGILDEILAFSRMEAGRLEIEEVEFDPRAVVEEAAEMFAVDAQAKGLELVCHVRPDVPIRVRGDPGRLRQALVNLIGNAVKFTDVGEVVVRAELEPSPRDDGNTHLMRFSVCDTGTGIASDKIDVLFESFRQLDGSLTRRHGGTGLGLAITKGIVEKMGGSVSVESHLEEGSTFSLAIPFRAVRAHRPGEPCFSTGVKGLKVLVVDDNRSSRLALCDMLAGLGAAGVPAADGEEGLQLLGEAVDAEAPFQAALLDSRLESEDGFVVAEQMLRVPSLEERVLLMTAAHEAGGDLARCLEGGFPGCLTKPVKQGDLVEALQRAVVEGLAATDFVERAAPTAEPRAMDGASKDGLPRRQARILLAEDDATSRLLFGEVLGQAGWVVTTVTNGRAAVEALEEEHFDLVLMDIQMPELDGLEATRRIRARDARQGTHTPIIGLTAYALERDVQRCLAAGMDDHLSKPTDFDRLLETVERHLPPGVAPEVGAEAVPADPSKVLEAFRGDKGRWTSLVNTFLETYPPKLWELREALHRGNGSEAASVAHRLRGSAAIFEAEAVVRLAEQVEKLGEGGQVDKARVLFEELQRELATLADFLSQY